ncbi:MAG TPA: hypothetical protein VG711_04900 [Phycisphaerales bacterium]|nr:hypothetical protein [Phycisphaerales bacterium]
MKTSKLILMACACSPLILTSSTRANFLGLSAIFEYNDGNGHDIYRVYADFEDTTGGVIACTGTAANPLTIQSRRNNDSQFGDNFYNPGIPSQGNYAPLSNSSAEVLNGTFVTIGVHTYNVLNSITGSYFDHSDPFPDFIANSNNFVSASIRWGTLYYTHPVFYSVGSYVNEGNDTATRVLIMQLAVSQGDSVRGTLNIKIGNTFSTPQTYLGQTFNSYQAPAPAALPLLAMSALFTRRRRLC